jgi:hypothetical protein
MATGKLFIAVEQPTFTVSDLYPLGYVNNTHETNFHFLYEIKPMMAPIICVTLP